MKVTVNNPELAKLLGIASGDKYEVDCQDGVPVTREWRNRFKDTDIDNCITIEKEKAGK